MGTRSPATAARALIGALMLVATLALAQAPDPVLDARQRTLETE